MLKQKLEFLEAIGATKDTCVEIEALLAVLNAYCKQHSECDETIYYIYVLLEIVLHKNRGLNYQINHVETFQRCII